MNPRRAAALALVGWYLMAPPLITEHGTFRASRRTSVGMDSSWKLPYSAGMRRPQSPRSVATVRGGRQPASQAIARRSDDRTAAGRALALRVHRKMLGAGMPPARHYDPALSRQPRAARSSDQRLRYPRERDERWAESDRSEAPRWIDSTTAQHVPSRLEGQPHRCFRVQRRKRRCAPGRAGLASGRKGNQAKALIRLFCIQIQLALRCLKV
jgi:hypothetical protein